MTLPTLTYRGFKNMAVTLENIYSGDITAGPDWKFPMFQVKDGLKDSLYVFLNKPINTLEIDYDMGGCNIIILESLRAENISIKAKNIIFFNDVICPTGKRHIASSGQIFVLGGNWVAKEASLETASRPIIVNTHPLRLNYITNLFHKAIAEVKNTDLYLNAFNECYLAIVEPTTMVNMTIGEQNMLDLFSIPYKPLNS